MSFLPSTATGGEANEARTPQSGTGCRPRGNRFGTAGDPLREDLRTARTDRTARHQPSEPAAESAHGLFSAAKAMPFLIFNFANGLATWPVVETGGDFAIRQWRIAGEPTG